MKILTREETEVLAGRRVRAARWSSPGDVGTIVAYMHEDRGLSEEPMIGIGLPMKFGFPINSPELRNYVFWGPWLKEAQGVVWKFFEEVELIEEPKSEPINYTYLVIDEDHVSNSVYVIAPSAHAAVKQAYNCEFKAKRYRVAIVDDMELYEAKDIVSFAKVSK